MLNKAVLRGIIQAFKAFATFFVFGIVFFFLRPLKYARRKELELKVHKLTDTAVKELNCGATSTYIILPTTGVKLHVVEAGKNAWKTNDMVIFLHGFPECWYSWRDSIKPTVEAGYHVVVPDMRGYNLSEKPHGVHNYKIEALVEDIKGIIEFYKREKVYLVAHDWGGVVAWYFASTYPELLHKLVIVNGPHPASWLKQILTNPIQTTASWYLFFFQIPYLAYYHLTFDPEKSVGGVIVSRKFKLSAFETEVYASAWVQPYAMHAMINYYKALVRRTLWLALERKKDDLIVRVPTKEIWGAADHALVNAVANVHKWVADLKIHYIEGCSHWVPVEAPEEATKQILSFIQES
jgi:pimeloyl-ACP methyl ester carboxylesterase